MLPFNIDEVCEPTFGDTFASVFTDVLSRAWGSIPEIIDWDAWSDHLFGENFSCRTIDDSGRQICHTNFAGYLLLGTASLLTLGALWGNQSKLREHLKSLAADARALTTAQINHIDQVESYDDFYRYCVEPESELELECRKMAIHTIAFARVCVTYNKAPLSRLKVYPYLRERLVEQQYRCEEKSISNPRTLTEMYMVDVQGPIARKRDAFRGQARGLANAVKALLAQIPDADETAILAALAGEVGSIKSRLEAERAKLGSHPQMCEWFIEAFREGDIVSELGANLRDYSVFDAESLGPHTLADGLSTLVENCCHERLALLRIQTLHQRMGNIPELNAQQVSDVNAGKQGWYDQCFSADPYSSLAPKIMYAYHLHKIIEISDIQDQKRTAEDVTHYYECRAVVAADFNYAIGSRIERIKQDCVPIAEKFHQCLHEIGSASVGDLQTDSYSDQMILDAVTALLSSFDHAEWTHAYFSGLLHIKAEYCPHEQSAEDWTHNLARILCRFRDGLLAFAEYGAQIKEVLNAIANAQCEDELNTIQLQLSCFDKMKKSQNPYHLGRFLGVLTQDNPIARWYIMRELQVLPGNRSGTNVVAYVERMLSGARDERLAELRMQQLHRSIGPIAERKATEVDAQRSRLETSLQTCFTALEDCTWVRDSLMNAHTNDFMQTTAQNLEVEPIDSRPYPGRLGLDQKLEQETCYALVHQDFQDAFDVRKRQIRLRHQNIIKQIQDIIQGVCAASPVYLRRYLTEEALRQSVSRALVNFDHASWTHQDFREAIQFSAESLPDEDDDATWCARIETFIVGMRALVLSFADQAAQMKRVLSELTRVAPLDSVEQLIQDTLKALPFIAELANVEATGLLKAFICEFNENNPLKDGVVFQTLGELPSGSTGEEIQRYLITLIRAVCQERQATLRVNALYRKLGRIDQYDVNTFTQIGFSAWRAMLPVCFAALEDEVWVRTAIMSAHERGYRKSTNGKWLERLHARPMPQQLGHAEQKTSDNCYGLMDQDILSALNGRWAEIEADCKTAAEAMSAMLQAIQAADIGDLMGRYDDATIRDGINGILVAFDHAPSTHAVFRRHLVGERVEFVADDEQAEAWIEGVFEYVQGQRDRRLEFRKHAVACKDALAEVMGLSEEKDGFVVQTSNIIGRLAFLREVETEASARLLLDFVREFYVENPAAQWYAYRDTPGIEAHCSGEMVVNTVRCLIERVSQERLAETRLHVLYTQIGAIADLDAQQLAIEKSELGRRLQTCFNGFADEPWVRDNIIEIHNKNHPRAVAGLLDAVDADTCDSLDACHAVIEMVLNRAYAARQAQIEADNQSIITFVTEKISAVEEAKDAEHLAVLWQGDLLDLVSDRLGQFAHAAWTHGLAREAWVGKLQLTRRDDSKPAERWNERVNAELVAVFHSRMQVFAQAAARDLDELISAVLRANTYLEFKTAQHKLSQGVVVILRGVLDEPVARAAFRGMIRCFGLEAVHDAQTQVVWTNTIADRIRSLVDTKAADIERNDIAHAKGIASRIHAEQKAIVSTNDAGELERLLQGYSPEAVRGLLATVACYDEHQNYDGPRRAFVAEYCRENIGQYSADHFTWQNWQQAIIEDYEFLIGRRIGAHFKLIYRELGRKHPHEIERLLNNCLEFIPRWLQWMPDAREAIDGFCHGFSGWGIQAAEQANRERLQAAVLKTIRSELIRQIALIRVEGGRRGQAVRGRLEGIEQADDVAALDLKPSHESEVWTQVAELKEIDHHWVRSSFREQLHREGLGAQTDREGSFQAWQDRIVAIVTEALRIRYLALAALGAGAVADELQTLLDSENAQALADGYEACLGALERICTQYLTEQAHEHSQQDARARFALLYNQQFVAVLDADIQDGYRLVPDDLRNCGRAQIIDLLHGHAQRLAAYHYQRVALQAAGFIVAGLNTLAAAESEDALIRAELAVDPERLFAERCVAGFVERPTDLDRHARVAFAREVNAALVEQGVELSLPEDEIGEWSRTQILSWFRVFLPYYRTNLQRKIARARMVDSAVQTDGIEVADAGDDEEKVTQQQQPAAALPGVQQHGLPPSLGAPPQAQSLQPPALLQGEQQATITTTGAGVEDESGVQTDRRSEEQKALEAAKGFIFFVAKSRAKNVLGVASPFMSVPQKGKQSEPVVAPVGNSSENAYSTEHCFTEDDISLEIQFTGVPASELLDEATLAKIDKEGVTVLSRSGYQVNIRRMQDDHVSASISTCTLLRVSGESNAQYVARFAASGIEIINHVLQAGTPGIRLYGHPALVYAMQEYINLINACYGSFDGGSRHVHATIAPDPKIAAKLAAKGMNEDALRAFARKAIQNLLTQTSGAHASTRGGTWQERFFNTMHCQTGPLRLYEAAQEARTQMVSPVA